MRKTIILTTCMMMQMGTFAFSKGQPSKVFKQSPPPMGFEENKGQIIDQYGSARQDIQYTLKAPGLDVFVSSGALHYQFYRTGELNPVNIPGMPKAANEKSLLVPTRTTTYRMDVTLVGANTNVIPTVAVALGSVNHYYTNARQKDGAAVRIYQKITYTNIYPGIDWVLYVQNNNLKYDFVVHPGANTANIQLQYNGAANIAKKADGSIQATTPYGIITEQAPKSYQAEDNKSIASGFQLNDKKLSYTIKDSYQGTLVIDPDVVWATYYGGGEEHNNISASTNSVACDPSGYIYMAGSTSSANNIATVGSYEDTLAAGVYAPFIAKFDSLGNRIWATYYCGTNEGTFIFGSPFPTTGIVACDSSYNIYLGGTTASDSGIATTGSYLDTLTAGSVLGFPVSIHAFLVQFDTAGIRQWGTYYGGTGIDQARGIICGQNKDVYIYGATTSSDGIATPGCYQDTLGPCVNCASTSNIPMGAFLAKFSYTGALQWGTYYGDGNQWNAGIFDAVCDTQDNIDILGEYNSDGTTADAAYSTPGTYQPTAPNATYIENYVAQFSNNGTRNWGTYYGDASANNVENAVNAVTITCDKTNHIYIAGITSAATGISTPGAYIENLPTPTSNTTNWSPGFLTQFNSVNGQRNWGTYYCGIITALACDPSDILYIAGVTIFPNSVPPYDNVFATPYSYQDSLIVDTVGGANNITDIFLAQFDSLGSRHWATYFGGGNESLNDNSIGGNGGGNNLVCDDFGNLYLTGLTSIDTHIATPGSFQDTLGTLDTAGTGATQAYNAFLVRFTPIDIAITGLVHDTVCTTDASVTITLQNKGHLPESNIAGNALYVYYNPNTGISDTSTATATTTSSLAPGATTTLTFSGLNLHGGMDTIQIYLQHIIDDSSFVDDTLYAAVYAIDSPSISGIIKSDTGIVWYFSDSNAQNVTHYQWYFGDGNTATGATTNHTYNASGNYTVMLVASNGCKSDTVTTNITATGLGVANVSNTGNIIVYPNPAQQQLNIQVPEKLQATEWQIINSVGAAVYSEKTDGQNGTKLIDVHSLSDGYYVLKVGTNEGNYNIPFEIMR